MEEYQDIVKRYNELNDRKKEAEMKISQSAGGLKQILSQLKEDYGISTEKEAQSLLEDMKKGQGELEAEISQDMEELENDQYAEDTGL